MLFKKVVGLVVSTREGMPIKDTIFFYKHNEGHMLSGSFSISYTSTFNPQKEKTTYLECPKDGCSQCLHYWEIPLQLMYRLKLW